MSTLYLSLKPPRFYCLGRSLLWVVLISALFLSLRPLSAQAAEDIKIKILAVNPLANKAIDSDITYSLPQEVTPADVLDSAGLQVKFNPDEKVYFLVGKVKLAAKESKTLEISVRDVWRVTPEKMEDVRSEITRKRDGLVGTRYAETGELLYQKALESLDQIESEQTQVQGIRRRIEFYRGAVKRLDQIQNDVLSIGSLRETEAGVGEDERIAKFQITAQNPSSEKRTMTVRADLPKEIQSEHVLNSSGFKLLFDAGKSRFVIEKKDEFQGRESKTYQIELKDIWYISPKQIENLRNQTDNLNKHFQTSNYAEFSAGITAEVMRLLKEIETLQAEVADSAAIQDRIRAYTLNSQKMNVVQARVKELQDLLMDLPITAEPKPVVETSPEGVREIQKVTDVSKILSMGLKPDLSTTWWIILGIIGFLMIFATIFYVVWIMQLKKNVYKSESESSQQAP